VTIGFKLSGNCQQVNWDNYVALWANIQPSYFCFFWQQWRIKFSSNCNATLTRPTLLPVGCVSMPQSNNIARKWLLFVRVLPNSEVHSFIKNGDPKVAVNIPIIRVVVKVQAGSSDQDYLPQPSS